MYSSVFGRLSNIVNWKGAGRWERWKAAKERPMVPAPTKVILSSFSDSIVIVLELDSFPMGYFGLRC